MRTGCAFALALALGTASALAAPKLDLNAVSAGALESLPGIGRATAERIVRIRERNGPYRCVEELRGVPRLTEAQFRALEQEVYVTGSEAREDCRILEESRRAGEPVRP